MPNESGAPPLSALSWPDGTGGWLEPRGAARWLEERELLAHTTSVIADGPIVAQVRHHYRFAGKGGLFNGQPAALTVTITLWAGRLHADIDETFSMGRTDGWAFDAAAGWSPQGTELAPHSKELIAGRPTDMPFPPTKLTTGQTRMGDVLLRLIPRWSQAYDDGWFGADSR